MKRHNRDTYAIFLKNIKTITQASLQELASICAKGQWQNGHVLKKPRKKNLGLRLVG